jgi:hypothetical protein
MPLIQSTVTARFINRTDLAEAVQSHKDPLSVSPKLLELQARLHASGTYRATSAPNETYFDIGVGETKMAPEWVKTDWGYYAHLINAQNGGKGIVELQPQARANLSAAVLAIPAGGAPPEESVAYGKTQPTPAEALAKMGEADSKKIAKRTARQ